MKKKLWLLLLLTIIYPSLLLWRLLIFFLKFAVHDASSSFFQVCESLHLRILRLSSDKEIEILRIGFEASLQKLLREISSRTQIEIEKDPWIDKKRIDEEMRSERQTNELTDKQIDRQTGRQAYRQTNKGQTERQSNWKIIEF